MFEITCQLTVSLLGYWVLEFNDNWNICVRCPCIEASCQFWYIPSGWMHSLDCCCIFFGCCFFSFPKCVVELRLYLSYQLVFYSIQHQRLFINHFWSMVVDISPFTSSITVAVINIGIYCEISILKKKWGWGFYFSELCLANRIWNV